MSFRDEGPRDPISIPRSSASDLPRPQAVVGPRDDTAGVLVTQDEVDAAVNNAALDFIKAKIKTTMKDPKKARNCSQRSFTR